MTSAFTRILALATFAAYLAVGAFVVRVVKPEFTSITLSSGYLTLTTDVRLAEAQIEELKAPIMAFEAIKLPVKTAPKMIAKVQVAKPVVRQIAKNELPFAETIKVEAVNFASPMMTNHLALFHDVKEEVIAMKEDAISTKQAVAQGFPEPEFFEYPVEAPKKTEETKTKVAQKVELDPALVAEAKAAPTKEVAEEVTLAELVTTPASQEAAAVEAPVEEAMTTQPVKGTEVVLADYAKIKPEAAPIVEEELIAFDYSKAKEDVTNQTMPTVTFSNVVAPVKPTTQVATSAPAPSTVKPSTAAPVVAKTKPRESQVDAYSAPKSLVSGNRSDVSLQAVLTDLKGSKSAQGFEVRFSDEPSSSLEDYGSGEIVISDNLSSESMTRASTILKRGFAPTNFDLIVKDGSSSMTVPMIDTETFNELQAPFESTGPIGAILVELDQDTEAFRIDSPSRRSIKLDGDMNQTESEDYTYELILGVTPGNTLISYKTTRGEIVSKIIHVHEGEVTFDANIYERTSQDKIELLEEDLLGQEPSALVTSADRVKIFATNKSAKKLNDRTYELDFGLGTIAGRRYIELNHQSEPVFVGLRGNRSAVIPSESFMRHILSLVEGKGLTNRCVIQVNVTKKVTDVSVGTESSGDSLMALAKYLDTDGKFYDSASEKTKKVIIVGENQSSGNESLDSRVNLKVTYQDGSSEYVGSYCSPNTYLVEQL
jgi:hypothetical protein